MISLIKSSQVKVGDVVRLSEQFIDWYTANIDTEEIDNEFRPVTAINVCESNTQEKYTLFFSGIPGDCFPMKSDETSKVEFPIEISS